MKPYSSELANQVYDVLTNVCQASELDRESFVFHATQGDIGEWRFGGCLGFGGKYRGETFRVDCYREDETPEARRIIDEANDALAKLRPAPRPDIAGMAPGSGP
jgi:hypothetical protein